MTSYQNTILSMIIFSILLIFNIIIVEIYFKLEENFTFKKEKTVYTQQMDIVSRSTEEQKKIMKNFYEEKHNLINELNEKEIDISMGIKKGALALIVKNPFEHCIKRDKTGRLLSTKQEITRHGYGVNSIRRVVEKHQGEVYIDINSNVFSITIIMNLEGF